MTYSIVARDPVTGALGGRVPISARVAVDATIDLETARHDDVSESLWAYELSRRS